MSGDVGTNGYACKSSEAKQSQTLLMLTAEPHGAVLTPGASLDITVT